MRPEVFEFPEPNSSEALKATAFTWVGADASREPLLRNVASETAIALEIGGIGYAVLMATANDLEDLTYGFLWSERLIDSPDQVEFIQIHPTDAGTILRIGINVSVLPRIHDRVRHRTSESSCGMCGLENLEQAMRPLPRLPASEPVDERAIFAALGSLRERQPLNLATGAVHAAALCSRDGQIRLVREDIGRHNGFDKLIGAMLRGGLDWEGGFGLLSSRCSYELVEKAVLAACTTLVTISAPTTLALRRAREANLTLFALARSDSMLLSE